MYLNRIDISEGPMKTDAGEVHMMGLTFHFSLEKKPQGGDIEKLAGHKACFLAIEKGVNIYKLVSGLRDLASDLESGAIFKQKPLKKEIIEG